MSGYEELIKKLSNALTATGGKLNTQKDVDLLTTKATPLQYPNDLFAHGKQAFIYFHVRDHNDPVGSLGSICLYMPSTMRVSYGADWENVTTPFQKLISTGQAYYEGIMGAASSALNAPGSSVMEKSMNAMQAVSDYTANNPGAQFAAHGWIAKELNASYAAEFRQYLGKTVNPFAALIYKSPTFRNFQFEFEFFPRNSDEADEARRIIKLFKLAMHPNREGDKDDLFWHFPCVFDVFLCTPYTDKMFMVKKAALVSANVDYAGSTVQSFFKDGNPVHTKLSLEFKELELLTRDEIYDNY
jgi:hypothetical protein